jgi:heptosyltransferase I
MRRGSKKNRLIDVWLGIPVLNVLATFRRHRQFPQSVERVGVMSSFALGDTLLFSGAVQSVRAHYPKARLICFCGPQNIAAVEMIPGIDEVVVVPLLKPRETIRQMRLRHLDLLLDFTSWQRLTALYSLMSGARFMVGFRTPQQHRHRGYDRTAEHSKDVHELGNFHSLLQAAAITEHHMPRVVPPAISLPELVTRGKRIVVFHLWPSGVSSFLREWPEERWIELARRLEAVPGHAETLFVVTGAPADQIRCESFVQKLRGAGLDAEIFIGHDRFASLSHVLLHAALTVSVNTGVMHLSAILGVPTISINGPNRNGRWGPVGAHVAGVESPGEGCGYLHLGFESKGKPTDCMKRITVDAVFAAAKDLMSVEKFPPTP